MLKGLWECLGVWWKVPSGQHKNNRSLWQCPHEDTKTSLCVWECVSERESDCVFVCYWCLFISHHCWSIITWGISDQPASAFSGIIITVITWCCFSYCLFWTVVCKHTESRLQSSIVGRWIILVFVDVNLSVFTHHEQTLCCKITASLLTFVLWLLNSTSYNNTASV